MKVPISTTIQTCNSVTGKSLSFDNTALNTAFQAPSTTFEPTSVLDLQRSPSPTSGQQSHSAAANHRAEPADLDSLDGWDSILSELGLNDEFTPNSKLWSQISPSDPHLPQLPEFPTSQPFDHHNPPPISLPSSDFNLCDFSYNHNPNFGPFDLHHNPHQTNPNNNTYGFDFIDDLVKAAHSLESNDSHQVHLILARLNQRLRSPTGKPLQRAAYYFKEALIAAAAGPTRPTRLSSYEVVQTIRAYKAFSGISPVSLFSTFAANQAILEAVDTAEFIHIVDFDIGFGGHWASFLRELVDKADPMKLSSVALRITAIVPEEFGIESKLVRENLSQFARDLNIKFHIDYVLFQSFEILSFKSVKFMAGEKSAVHLSPAVFQRLGNGISKFLADLRSISPSSVVVVDREIGIDIGTSSFSMNFVVGIEFYAAMLESLDVATAGGLIGGVDCVRKIETFVLRPRIMAMVEAAASAATGRRTAWREAFTAAGIRAVGFSQFADFQAECLLRRAQVGGFHVAKRHGEMMLYWHEHPLVATSAWRC